MDDFFNRILTLDWLIDGVIFSVFAFIVSKYYKIALYIPLSVVMKIVKRRDRKIERILNDDVLLYSEISFRNTLIGSLICVFFMYMIASGMMIAYCYINLSISFYLENEFINIISRSIIVLIGILEIITFLQYNFVRELKKKRNKIKCSA